MGKYVRKPVTTMKWVLEGSPVAIETEILRLITENHNQPLKPTTLLDSMVEEHNPPYEYRQVQDAMLRLLDNGEIEMDSHRNLVINNS